MNIKTRFAPSSTGCLHIGSVRTALYSWLFAQHYNGSFILRIEDTDIKRSNNQYIDNIIKTLKWLGIFWDEGPYLQSDRLTIYKNKINELLDSGHAYRCYCSIDRLKKLRLKQILHGYKPNYDRKCRDKKRLILNNQDYVVRFKNPVTDQVIFHDQIRGKIIFNNSELDDLVIQRRNGMPTYNFCVVIDDLDMNITHVIRGEDHINNTPRQINILKALNAYIPNYAHVSMVINPDKSNFSKRKNACDVLEYKEKGFLKEAILNYLLRLGWSYQNQEIFDINEIKKIFSIRNISKSPSEFNLKKLLWFNSYYLNKLPIDCMFINQLKKYLIKLNIQYNQDINIIKVIELMRSRCSTLQELAVKSRFFFDDIINIDAKLMKKYFFKQYNVILQFIYDTLYSLKFWNAESIIYSLKSIAMEFSILLKNIFMSLRIAITGSDQSPNISVIMEILGKERTLCRIKKLLKIAKDMFD
ncbi:glutamate--tRNA ligase [Buchnera aphidicola (Takecallis taiwana)]|uniref:glutamate--tRNA ligase n=1 Tax=Buchnera aphidicola TaxID=9 RepID=UPI0031B7EF52